MADDLSLLFRLKADNAQAKAVITDTRAAVAQLRQSFGPQLTQSVTVANKAFSDIGDNLNNFVAQRVPLVGGALVRITEGLRNAGGESSKTDKAIAGVAKSIESIATQSGKSVPQIASFLTKFVQIEGQAKRDKAAIDFFGASLGTKLIPELEKTSTALAGVATEGAATGSVMAGLSHPIALVVIALAAQAAAAAVVAKELFDLTKNAAEFQGRMFDLAQQTGVSVETLSALEIAAKTTGGEIGSLTNSIVTFQRRLEESVDPSSKAADTLRRFNISAVDTELALRQAFSALAAMPEGFTQTNAAAELFGARGGKQILAILKETNGDLDGAIRRFRELGILIDTDSAAAADKFNDELELLNFQIRALTAVAAEDLIPALAGTIEAIGELVRAVRPLIAVFGLLAGVTARRVTEFFQGLQLLVRIAIGDYTALAEAIKKAREEATIPIPTNTGVQPVPLPGAPSPRQAASEAVSNAEAVAAAVKRAVARNSQELDQLFQAGRLNRQQQTDAAIEDIKREAKAESDRIDALIAKRNEEFKVARDHEGRESEAARKIAEDVQKLQTEQLDKQADAQRKISELRFRARQEAADQQREAAQVSTNEVIKELDRGIAAIQERLGREDLARTDSLTSLDQFEQAKIEIQILGLERQRDIGRLSVDEQRKINTQIRGLQQDLDLLRDDQERRRQDRQRQLNERTRSLIETSLDTQLEILRTHGESLIATENALAELRVQTNEDAARRILKINLDLIDAQIELVKARFEAAKTLPDQNEALRLQVELTNQSKILIEQRKAIEAQGNRSIEEGRREDLENERRYADELIKLKERIRNVQRDAARTVIELMVLQGARRKQIIKARAAEDIAEENDRHQRELRSIAEQQRENRESNRTQEEKLEKEQELNRLREAEMERHRLAIRETKEREKQDQKDVEGIFVPGINLPDIEEGAGIITSVTAGLKAALEELKTIGLDAFASLAQGVGSLVQNYVLLGTTGPAALRKLLAATLAQIAAESAVKAIYWTAQGIVDLFFNPARAAADFTAAALFASIAGGAALAGRAVAGGLFKPPGSAGGSGSDSRPNELNPLSLARNAGPGSQQQIVPIIQPIFRIEVVPDGTKFGNAVTAHVVEDFNNAGPIREITGNDGNLNRG